MVLGGAASTKKKDVSHRHRQRYFLFSFFFPLPCVCFAETFVVSALILFSSTFTGVDTTAVSRDRSSLVLLVVSRDFSLRDFAHADDMMISRLFDLSHNLLTCWSSSQTSIDERCFNQGL